VPPRFALLREVSIDLGRAVESQCASQVGGLGSLVQG
jgi:hypothetical protein